MATASAVILPPRESEPLTVNPTVEEADDDGGQPAPLDPFHLAADHPDEAEVGQTGEAAGLGADLPAAARPTPRDTPADDVLLASASAGGWDEDEPEAVAPAADPHDDAARFGGPEAGLDEVLAILDGDAPAVAPAAATGDKVGGSHSAPAPLTAAHALTRAQALVDELRALLPAALDAPSSPVDPNGIAADLAAVRSLNAEAASGGLRDAVAMAQQHPSDLGAALEIMKRIDAIATMLQSHDRLAAAVDLAIARLRGQEADNPGR